MGRSVPALALATLVVGFVFSLQAEAAPAGPLIKHLSSIIKWSRSAAKSPQSDENHLQFENGYLVETVAEGNDLGMVPYTIRVSQDGELFAVDEVNSNIVKITPPLSQYSRARLVAGSFQGYTGHVDGKPSEARFNKPRGVAMDDKGNVYVADTVNLAIRKIGDSGVTTIAGGKSNVAGFRDGPSEDAKFSSDFDVVYVRETCSLLVVDRGNAALRKISLYQEDCDYDTNSITLTDMLLVLGAVIVGYITCIIQQGFGSPTVTTKSKETTCQPASLDKRKSFAPVVDSVKDEPIAGWPSFGQLIVDLSKLALDAITNVCANVVPSLFRRDSNVRGLDPLQDRLKMPDDEVEPQLVRRQRTPAPAPTSERLIHTPTPADKYSDLKPAKIRSSSFKDPLSTKHRSSKRQDFSEFYGPSEIPSFTQVRSKSQKDRTRHRQREKSGEVTSGAASAETKPAEMKPLNYEEPKFSHYNFRSKYGSTLPPGFD